MGLESFRVVLEGLEELKYHTRVFFQVMVSIRSLSVTSELGFTLTFLLELGLLDGVKFWRGRFDDDNPSRRHLGVCG